MKRRFVRYVDSRSACRLTGVDPETVRRECPPDNQDILEEMKQLAAKRRRFRYRRTGVLLEENENEPQETVLPLQQGKAHRGAQAGSERLEALQPSGRLISCLTPSALFWL